MDFIRGLALTFLLAASSAHAAQAEPQDPAVREGPRGVLSLGSRSEEAGITLRQLITSCHQLTGIPFTYDSDPQVERDLDSITVKLFGPMRVRKESYYALFQVIMKANGFACVPIGEDELEVIKIVRVNGPGAIEIKANARYVQAQRVEDFRKYPGTYIRTIVPLEHANAQSAGTNLRTAMSSGGPLGMQDGFMPLQLGSGQALLVQGFGPFVANAVQMVHELDAGSAPATGPEGRSPVAGPGGRGARGALASQELAERLAAAEAELRAAQAAIASLQRSFAAIGRRGR